MVVSRPAALAMPLRMVAQWSEERLLQGSVSLKTLL
jgi:hypothetical protein